MKTSPGEKFPVDLPRLWPVQRYKNRRSDPPANSLERHHNYLPKTGSEKLRKIGRGILVGALVFDSTLVGTDGFLIATGLSEEYQLSQTKPSIINEGEAYSEANRHTAVIVALGFGGLNASNFSAEIAPELRKEGDVLAIKYDNKGIDTDTLADAIGKRAKKDDITKLSWYGDSIGGVLELSILKKVITGGYGITDIPSFTFDSTPDSPQDLHYEYSSEGSVQSALHEWLPVQSQGEFARWLVEMYIRRNQYSGSYYDKFNPGMIPPMAALKTSGEIWNDTIESPNAASNQLLNSEYETFADSDPKDLISSIGKFESDHDMPETEWQYIGNPDDYVVNTVASSHDFNQEITQAGFAPLRIDMNKGIIHGEPLLTPTLYKETLETIVPELNKAAYKQVILANSKKHHKNGGSDVLAGQDNANSK